METIADKFLSIVKDEDLTGYNAVKVITDKDEFFNSDELAERFSGFQMGSKISVMKNFKFIKAYILEDDSIYRLYELDNGLQVLKKVEIHSMISKSGVCEAICFDNSFVINRKTYYKKSDKSFKLLKEAGKIITD